MRNIDFRKNAFLVLFIFFALFNIKYAYAQRTYASSQTSGAAGLLCANCTVNNAANAADGNLQTFSTLNVTLGVGGQTYQQLQFAGTKPAAGTPVTVKLGTGNKLLSLTLLGNISLQAYDGATAVGQPVAVNTLLSAVSNDNQVEVSITPQQAYNGVRVTLNGGLVGALSSIDLYEAFYTGSAAGACGTAVDELHGVSGGLLGSVVNVGGVANPQQAIDGNLNTASTLNAGVNLLGEYAQQTIIYQNQSVIGDSVRLTLSIPQALLNVGLLSNISVATYNGNNNNGDLTLLSSSLLTVRLLDFTSDRKKVIVTFVPAKVFDRVQLRLGGVANVLSTLDFYEAQRLIPKPIIKINNVVTNSAQICTGGTAVLAATAVPNTVFHWYTQATGGSPVYTGATFTTPVLNATATYYVAAMRNGCTDESDRTKITVTVNAIPVAPVVTNNTVSVCSGQTATFTANSVAGVTINWYNAATGGTLLYTGNSFTTAPITQATDYFAEAVSGTSCVSTARTKVTASITPPPAAPSLTAPNVTICDGSVATLSVSTPQTGIIYNWYTTATGGTPVFTGAVYTTAALHNNINYFVEAVNAGGCNSAQRTEAMVTVVASPADAVLAANSTSVAAGQQTTIGVTNTQTGITYNWYTSAAAATPVFTGATFTTPLLYTNTTYYVSAVNSTGCTSVNRTAITINVTINNNSPCTFANQQSVTVNGVCLGCGVANAALATDADTTTASTINVLAGLAGGYAQQELNFQQPGYAGDTIKLVLQNPNGLLSAAVLGNIQVLLYNGTTQVSAYALNNALIKVSLLAGSSNKYAVYIPATAGYDRLYVRINSGLASVLTPLNIYYAVQQYPKPVFNPASPEICKGSDAVINLTSPAAGTYSWFTTPTGGVAIHTGTSLTTGALNGNTIYYVQYARGACDAPVRFPVQVLVDDAPAAPTIAAQNVTITSGQKATLNATASNNAAIQWFTGPTGGTPVFTGNPFITPALTTNQTYYAGTALGSCVSATRTPVTVTVQPVVIPSVSVTPPTATLSPGQSTTFTASSTTPGAVFNWYTTPTGGTSIFTGPAYTTPPQFANITYYAEASVPSTGAISATRATGKVTINQQAVNPVPCDAAIDQTNTTSGLLCVGCGVFNATGAVDNDRNTFAQLNVPVGLVSASASQTLRFANTGLAGDSVIIELGVPGTLASVGVLSQIAISTANGATANGDSFSVNGSLLSINLLSGTSRFRVAFKAQHNFDRVVITLNAALAGVFSSLNIYDAAQEVSAPVISTTAVATCQGSQATVTATAPADATIKWYTSATGGAPVFTGTTFTTPALTATTTYYAEASRTADGCTQAVRTPATVTVVTAPAAPVVAAPVITVCSGQPATFSVTPVNGVTYSWYTSPAGGVPVNTGAAFTTPALTNTAVYYVEAANAGQCSSSTRTKVTANVTATPADAVVTPGSTQTCSESSAVLTASSSQPGVTFNWYTSAAGTTPVFTGAQFTTPALTQNTSYYVEAASGSCVSADRTKADVTVNPAPVAPTVAITPAGGQITSGQTANLSVSSATAGLTFNWYTSAANGTAIHTGATFTTPALTTNTTYYVEAVSATSGCISPQRTAVTVIVNPVFSTSCDFASTQTNSISGVACLLCGVTGGDNAVNTDTTDFSQLNLGVGAVGYVAQKLIFGDSGLAGDTVTVKIKIPVSLATVGVLSQLQIGSFNNNTDNGDRVALNSSLIRITILAGGQTALVKFVPKAAYNAVEVRLVTTVSLFNSLNIYYATKQVPIAQLTAKTVNICQGSTATFTVSTPVNGVTYKWYSAAAGGSLLHTGTSYTTAAINATQTFYVESSRTSNSCPNPNRVAAAANVTPAPVNPVLAQSAVAICAGDQVTLSVTNANGATVTWYDAATGGTLLFTGANYLVSPIATASYYAEISSGACGSPARTLAKVTVNPRPAAPGVESASVQVCMGSPATLKVLNPATGVNYQWFTTATGGNPASTGSTFVTPGITQNIIYYVQATDATTDCANNGGRTAVNISVSNQLSAPVLSATTTSVCNGGSATLSVANPVNGLQYSWYTQAAGGVAVFTGTTFTVNNLTGNIAYFVEASNSTGCTSTARTQTSITVQPVPTAPQVQADAGSLAVCQGSSASLSIVNPQANVVYRWFDAATAGTLLYTGTQFNTPPLTGSTTYYVEASEAGNCNPSARTMVTVTTNALPADPALAVANVKVCAGLPATFNIQAPQTGITYQWFDSPSQTNKLFEGTTFITGPITANTIYYVAAVNATGCQSANLTTAQATIQAPPSAPVVTNGTTVQTCINSQVTLSISNPQAGFTYSWYSTSNGTTPLGTGTSYTTAVLAGNTTFYVDAANSTGCTSSARTQVTINVNQIPVAPVITAQGGSANTSVCSGKSITLVANSTTANVTFNWYTQAAGGVPVFTGAAYTTQAITAPITFFVEAVGPGSCVSTTRTAVQVTINSGTTPSPQVNAADLSICQNTATTIHITTPDGATVYNWYALPTGGNSLYTGTAFTTGILPANQTYYVEAADLQYCNASARLAVNVVIVPQPVTPVPANATLTVCKGSQATLAVQSPQLGIVYKWYSDATRSNLLFTGPSYTTDPINANATFYADASNGSCSSPSIATVQVNITSPPPPPLLVSAAATACSGSQTLLSISNPESGFTYNWYTAANGGAPVYTGTDFTTPVLSTNTTYYAEAVNAAGCNSGTRTAANVVVTPSPAPPQVTAPANAMCPGNTAILTSDNSNPAVTVKWFANVTGGTALATGNSFTTPVLSASTTYYAEAFGSGGCSTGTRTAATVMVLTPLNAPVVSVADSTASTLTFAWSAVPGALSYEISLSNGASFTAVGSDLSYKVSGLQPLQSITIVVRALGNSDCQLSANSAAVTGITTNPLGNAIFVPNAFSPNGDGNNDIFRAYGNTIKSMTMSIYDQWGGLMFKSQSMAAGWDGTFKGRAQPVGVYVYYIEAVLNDGQSVKKKGTINLLR